MLTVHLYTPFTLRTLRRDPANFTVHRIIETFRNSGYGDTLEEKSQEARDNYCDMTQGRVQVYNNREEMMSLSPQNSTTTMRGCWLARTSALSEQEIAGIRIVTEGSAGPAVKWAIQQTIVSRRRVEGGDGRREQEDRAHDKTGSAALSDREESESVTDVEKSLDEHNLWDATDDNAVFEAVSGCVRPERNYSMRRNREGSTRNLTTDGQRT